MKYVVALTTLMVLALVLVESGDTAKPQIQPTITATSIEVDTASSIMQLNAQLQQTRQELDRLHSQVHSGVSFAKWVPSDTKIEAIKFQEKQSTETKAEVDPEAEVGKLMQSQQDKAVGNLEQRAETLEERQERIITLLEKRLQETAPKATGSGGSTGSYAQPVKSGGSTGSYSTPVASSQAVYYSQPVSGGCTGSYSQPQYSGGSTGSYSQYASTRGTYSSPRYSAPRGPIRKFIANRRANRAASAARNTFSSGYTFSVPVSEVQMSSVSDCGCGGNCGCPGCTCSSQIDSNDNIVSPYSLTYSSGIPVNPPQQGSEVRNANAIVPRRNQPMICNSGYCYPAG